MTPLTWLPLAQVVTEAKAGFACGEEDPRGVFQIRMNNITRGGKLDLTRRRRVPPGHRSVGANTLRPGDILFNATNSPELVGKTAIFSDLEERAVLSNHFLRLRTKPELVIPEYLAYWLQAQFEDGLFRSMCRQWVNQATLSRESLLSLSLPLPPIDVQHRIRQVLEATDALREKRRASIVLLDDLARSIFRDMFGDFRKDDRELEWIPIDEAGVVQLGRQRAPKYQTGQFTRPYIRVANVHEDRIDTADILSMDFDSHDFAKFKLEYGDILLNEGQSTELVGRPAMWRGEIEDCCFQNTLVRFQANAGVIDPRYALAAFLRYFHMGEFAKVSTKTSSVAHLGAARFGKMLLPVPSIEKQREFSGKMAILDTLKSSHQIHLVELDALFASLQSRAFRGELWDAPTV